MSDTKIYCNNIPRLIIDAYQLIAKERGRQSIMARIVLRSSAIRGGFTTLTTPCGLTLKSGHLIAS